MASTLFGRSVRARRREAKAAAAVAKKRRRLSSDGSDMFNYRLHSPFDGTFV